MTQPDAPAATSHADEPFPDHHNDLAATLKFAWQMIGRGVQDRRSAFHTPVLATQSVDGPQARVLVLRAADTAQRSLTFHTDTRSPVRPVMPPPAACQRMLKGASLGCMSW